MKKTLLLGAAILAAMTMNAQVVKTVAEVCNYLDIQAEAATLTAVSQITSTEWATASNGSVFKGYAKSDGSEAEVKWNVKEDYNTSIIMPEMAGVLDTLIVGTMYRSASGGSIELGDFVTTADGKVQVYFQPNGDSNRGVEISCEYLSLSNEVLKSGEKIDGIRPGYVAELEIPAGEYYAGDIVIKVVSNTCNIFGVNIENLQGTALSNTIADAGISYNGREILNPQAKKIVVYNVLGKQVAQGNGNINMDSFQSGVYLVRAEGIKNALKIRK